MNLVTSRLLLRPLKLEDSLDWFRVSQDAGLTKFQITNYKMANESEAVQWILDKERLLQEQKMGTLGVFLKEGEELIGVCGLKELQLKDRSLTELMFRLVEAQWNKGFATEIGCALISYAKDKMSLSKVVATVDPDNFASKAVLKKLGFQYSESMVLSGQVEELHIRAL